MDTDRERALAKKWFDGAPDGMRRDLAEKLAFDKFDWAKWGLATKPSNDFIIEVLAHLTLASLRELGYRPWSRRKAQEWVNLQRASSRDYIRDRVRDRTSARYGSDGMPGRVPDGEDFLPLGDIWGKNDTSGRQVQVYESKRDDGLWIMVFWPEPNAEFYKSIAVMPSSSMPLIIANRGEAYLSDGEAPGDPGLKIFPGASFRASRNPSRAKRRLMR